MFLGTVSFVGSLFKGVLSTVPNCTGTTLHTHQFFFRCFGNNYFKALPIF